MPRIPAEDIRRLKKEVSLVRLCERYGIELKSQGKNLAIWGQTLIIDFVF